MSKWIEVFRFLTSPAPEIQREDMYGRKFVPAVTEKPFSVLGPEEF